jgi:hypothetical protein
MNRHTITWRDRRRSIIAALVGSAAVAMAIALIVRAVT